MKKPQLFTTGRILSAACLGVVAAFGATADDVALAPTDQGRVNLTRGNTRAGSLGDPQTIRTGTSGLTKNPEFANNHLQGFTIFDTSGVSGPINNASFDFEVWQPDTTALGAVEGDPGDLEIWGVASTAGFDTAADNAELNSMVTDGGVQLLNLGAVAPGVQNANVTSFVNAQRVAGNSTFALMFKHSNVTFDDQLDFYRIFDGNDASATQTPELNLSTVLTQPTPPAPTSFTVSDATPGGASTGSGTRTLTSTLGSVLATTALPALTYTVSNVDLTGSGGGANETIVFDITYSAEFGAPAYNGFGNVAVDGGIAGQIDGFETLTATVSLNEGLTTYAGDIDVNLSEIQIGGVGASDTWFYYFEDTGLSPKSGSSALSTYNFDGTDTDFVQVVLNNLTSTINIQRLNVDVDVSALPPFVAYSFGDANGDGAVDGLDVDALAQGFGASGNWSSGDFNGDGTVDGLDVDALAQNFGAGQAAAFEALSAYGITAVPEPTSAALLALGGLLVARRRRSA